MHTTDVARTGHPAAQAWWAVGAAAAVLALLTWAVTAGWSPLLHTDRAVSEALYAGDDRGWPAEWALQVATAPGSAAVRAAVLVPVLAWLALRRAWWAAAWVLVGSALVGLLTTLMKETIGRQRPQFAEGGARLETLSFPSGHASGIATLVTVALVLAWPLLAPSARRAWLATGAVLVLLVGLTRMWLGVHYLSDVLGGWALGVGWVLLVALAFGALPGGRAALRPGGTP